VPYQQLQSQLHTQHSADIHIYIPIAGTNKQTKKQDNNNKGLLIIHQYSSKYCYLINYLLIVPNFKSVYTERVNHSSSNIVLI
jgi:hypothetical protein